MEKHFRLSVLDSEFEKKFVNCELDPKDFSHQAHIQLARVYIIKYGIFLAEKNIQTGLRKFVAFVGRTDKYNQTLPVAAIKAVCHFMKKPKSNNFQDFITEFPRLKYNFKELMAFHYGFDIYNSKKAWVTYLEPYLIPFY